MEQQSMQRLEVAIDLMNSFSRRTGLETGRGDESRRYLWTDAFAVQTFFGLSHVLKDSAYQEKAIKLIDLVHQHLGKYHPDDERKGWLSGLSEEEGQEHPTAGGLRIGKKLPERKANEIFDERLEWERDGQYFHYITRWINALLQAHQETRDKKYAAWAIELLIASEKFITSEGGNIRMYWKMSLDLSRPLVASMGAHDPLEGLICTKSAQEAVPERAADLDLISHKFTSLCAGQDWSTYDPLGIGGLLLNALRAAGLSIDSVAQLPSSVKPDQLLFDSLDSLQGFSRTHISDRSANRRLAFRECGLSLGVQAVYGMKDFIANSVSDSVEKIEKYRPVAREIEDFWSDPASQNAVTWNDHLDINAVSLAASLTAAAQPASFAGLGNL